MSLFNFFPPMLIAASAVLFAIFVSRAQALRMRELREDILTGNLRGYLVVLVVIIMIIATFVFQD